MPNSHPITLPPPRPAPVVPPMPTQCFSNFQRNLEGCIKHQQDAMLGMMAAMYGFDICCYNPIFTDSVYDEEDQSYHYPLEPNFIKRVLIKGLYEYLRFGGTDQWSMPEVTLYDAVGSLPEIKENARIVVNAADQHVSFRAKVYRVQFGQFVAYRKLYTLIPWM